VRFGEVEARGIALTVAGRDLYDRMVAESDALLALAPAGTTRVEVAAQVWAEHLPRTEKELALKGLAFFTYRLDENAVGSAPLTGTASLADLVEAGIAVPEPIVYEDFLPRSAAGIFQSNLTEEGSKDDEQTGTSYDIHRMSQIVGAEVHDPNDLYQRQQDESIEALAHRLNITVTH